jgi:hypothetical protein
MTTASTDGSAMTSPGRWSARHVELARHLVDRAPVEVGNRHDRVHGRCAALRSRA